MLLEELSSSTLKMLFLIEYAYTLLTDLCSHFCVSELGTGV